MCGPGAATPNCPVHAMWDQKLLLSVLFAARCSPSSSDLSLPLFPTESGHVVSTKAMKESIRIAARLLQCPLESPDGAERITGHSLRPTGAQGLARMGLDTWSIELLGRWGGKCVRQYVRAASVSSAAARARALTMRAALAELTDQPADAEPASQASVDETRLRQRLEAIAPDCLVPWRVSLLAEVNDVL